MWKSAQITVTSASVVNSTYSVVVGSGDTYGLNTANMNGQKVSIVWDKLNVTSLSAVSNRISVGAAAVFTANGTYEYDLTVWHGMFSMNSSLSQSTVGKYWYNISSVTDSLYGITVFQETAPSVYVIFDEVKVTITASSTSPSLGTTVNFTVTTKYVYDGSPTGTVTINFFRNQTHFSTGNFSDVEAAVSLNYYTCENVTDSAYGLTAFTSNTVTVYWAAANVEALTVQAVDLDGGVLQGCTVDFNNGSDILVQTDVNGLATMTQIAQGSVVSVKVKWSNVWVFGSSSYTVSSTQTVTCNCNVWTLTFLAKDNDSMVVTSSPSIVYWTFPNGTALSSSARALLLPFCV